MGPGIQEYPLLLHREAQQKGSHSHANENHKGMVNNGKSHPSTKGLKKPISPVKPSSGRLGKNVSSAIEKISQDTQDGNQPNVCRKGRNQLDSNTQSKRTPSVCPSLHSIPGPKRSLPERRQNESFLHGIPPSTKGSTPGSFCRVKDVPVQHFYCSEKEQFERNHEEHGASPSSSKWQEASVGEMFLDFESVQIIKEDAEDDSASDLSDSERIPIPPSPCTPPELILRAEEIDPDCLEHVPEMGFKESEYYYPDFLPPPFNSWDLKQLAIFVHVEGKTDFRPKPTGFLEKYMERLLQLEWLQLQTVQNEKGRAGRARPHTAPGPGRALRSPAKAKAPLSPLPSRQLVPQDCAGKLPGGWVGAGAEPCQGERRQGRSHPKAPERTPAQRQPGGDTRAEPRKKPPAKQQLLHGQPSENSPKIQSVGNIRPPKQSPVFHGAAAPIKGLKTHPCANPKRNGNAGNCAPPKKPAGDRKMKTNGTKQTGHKFK